MFHDSSLASRHINHCWLCVIGKCQCQESRVDPLTPSQNGKEEASGTFSGIRQTNASPLKFGVFPHPFTGTNPYHFKGPPRRSLPLQPRPLRARNPGPQLGSALRFIFPRSILCRMQVFRLGPALWQDFPQWDPNIFDPV